MRADQSGDDMPPIDIAGKHHGDIGGAGEAHIGDVAAPQIGLGRAAGAFDQNEVAFGFQPVETLQADIEQFGFALLIGGGAAVARHAAAHDELRAGLALRFEQHRVHMHAGRGAAGQRLQRLGAADLPAIRR